MNCTSTKGSGIYVDDSSAVLNNTIFDYMYAESGAAIFALNDAVLDIKHSRFKHSSVAIGGIITFSESTLNMNASTIDEFIGGAIAGEASKNLQLLNMTI